MCTPHSVPSSCTLCQPVLIVSTSDKKYRFGVPFKVLTKQVGLYIQSVRSWIICAFCLSMISSKLSSAFLVIYSISYKCAFTMRFVFVFEITPNVHLLVVFGI